ncbi:DGQHR domain-containing protein [Maricaulis sp.]|uniref:DGQHR domain-containing protein n=1 Tax=Maricaulis sp. TaxID=1486257 RepID=UPI003A8C91D3
MINEDRRSTSFPVMRLHQPIGDFYVGKMTAKDLIEISWFDIRRLNGDNGFEEYLGIQRKINEQRVQEIAKYVGLSDATFPTAVILAVEARCAEVAPICAEVGEGFYNMTLNNLPGAHDHPTTVLYRGIARVLDGQHRIRGLKESGIALENFEVNVCVFVDADIADQASIFATVNLAQTKVNRSLVYDLLSYSEARSPERTCHTVTVTLDKAPKSPFFEKIKRLGVATDGRFGEVLTQATVVQSLLPLVSNDVLRDRDIGKRVGHWRNDRAYDRARLIFRHWFIEGDDDLIATQLMNYFEAVRRRWPEAWEVLETGNMLPRSNGFRAFMSFLRPAYNALSESGELVKMSAFYAMFEPVTLTDADFNTQIFPPGSSGERGLYHRLMQDVGLGDYE